MSKLMDKAQARARVDTMRQQIESLEAALLPLQQEMHRLQRQLMKHTPGITPIHSLPDSVLYEIFLWTLPTARERALSVKSSSLNPSIPPMSLCLVCKRWRGVAKESPVLWATLRLFIAAQRNDSTNDWGRPRRLKPGRDRILEADIAHYLKSWKKLTQKAPIELHFAPFNLDTLTFSNKEEPPVLRSLAMGDFERLTKLSLCRVRYQDVEALPQGAFVTLQELILSITYLPKERNPHPERRVVRAFEVCPKLRRAALWVVDPDSPYTQDSPPTALEPIFVSLPWTQLSHLFIVHPASIRFIQKYLADCPHLRFLHFACMDNVPMPVGLPTAKWNWPKLSHLSVRIPTTRPDVLVDYLRHVDPQGLGTLRFMGDYLRGDFSSEGQANLSLWLQDARALQTLGIFYMFPLDSPSYLNLFRCVPSLTTFEINGHCSPIPQPWDLFNPLIQNPWLLPKLTTVIANFTWAHPSQTYQRLASFVETRMNRGVPSQDIPPSLSSPTGEQPLCLPLRRLVVRTYSSRSTLDSGIAVLNQFKGEGLKVEHEKWSRTNACASGEERDEVAWVSEIGDIDGWDHPTMTMECDEALRESWPELYDFLVVGESIENLLEYYPPDTDSDYY